MRPSSGALQLNGKAHHRLWLQNRVPRQLFGPRLGRVFLQGLWAESYPTQEVRTSQAMPIALRLTERPGADMILIRMQAEKSKPPAQRYGYKNAIHGLYRMVKDEGMAQAGRSLNLTVFRAILTNVGQLASSVNFRDSLIRSSF